LRELLAPDVPAHRRESETAETADQERDGTGGVQQPDQDRGAEVMAEPAGDGRDDDSRPPRPRRPPPSIPRGRATPSALCGPRERSPAETASPPFAPTPKAASRAPDRRRQRHLEIGARTHELRFQFGLERLALASISRSSDFTLPPRSRKARSAGTSRAS
jgi:hypothetical protein